MLTALFLLPGRLVAKLFSRDRKKTYRSLRHRSEAGGGLYFLSLLVWLALAGGALHALDKAGLLKRALDVGVEAAQGANQPAAPLAQPPAAPPETGSASVSGALGEGARLETASGAPATLETEMWLVILHTIPKDSRAEAERRQGAYKAKGLTVEILDTNAFPRLQPNFWVIALGPFDDRATALAAADRVKTFNAGLMVRRGL